ncbi:hypothetical protein H4W81_007399 [Nonomuraea africana]|uniref:SAM-dependent methyltransferase n=1 Tax=Nonomuraea africana TaxID=46171 RepID=A0ABR9KRG9_9ACTN|nr:hypothetical protein [Nonomuraea africana]
MNRAYAHQASYVEAAVRAGWPDLAAQPVRA